MKKNKNITAKQIKEAEEEIEKFQKRIDFYTVDYSIDYIVDRMHQGLFEIPDYQREFLWDLPRQSKFIESLHMGLPIPFLFFWETEEGLLEIVDGSQRIRTITNYVTDGLILTELEKIKSLNGTCFTDLPEGRQRKFKNRAIRGILLHPGADEEARQMLFDRINTGSLIATPAEIRHGSLGGKFLGLVIELAKSDKFARLAPISEKAKDMRVNEELVTRFFAYADGLEEYNQSPNKFIFDYADKMNKKFEQNDALMTDYTKRFEQMLDFVDSGLPFGFAKTKTAKSTPRVRFDSIAIGVDMALKEKPELLSQNISMEDMINSDEFKKLTTSDAANVKSKIVNRTTYIRDALLEKVNG